jgi:hypothetical protein
MNRMGAKCLVERKRALRTLAQMSFAEFQQSVADGGAPLEGASLALQTLWHDARGNWDHAHACAQEAGGREGAWVHAYLHRKEGDLGNAGYWYARARRAVPAADVTLKAEWTAIARELLEKK